MILVSKYLVPNGYYGITIFPFIFLKYQYLKSNQVFINHEEIHKRQQLEMLVIPFYIFYGLEFLIRLIYFRQWRLAYKNISFEREAYSQEKNLEFLRHRPFWNFLKYLKYNGV